MHNALLVLITRGIDRARPLLLSERAGLLTCTPCTPIFSISSVNTPGSLSIVVQVPWSLPIFALARSCASGSLLGLRR